MYWTEGPPESCPASLLVTLSSPERDSSACTVHTVPSYPDPSYPIRFLLATGFAASAVPRMITRGQGEKMGGQSSTGYHACSCQQREWQESNTGIGETRRCVRQAEAYKHVSGTAGLPVARWSFVSRRCKIPTKPKRYDAPEIPISTTAIRRRQASLGANKYVLFHRCSLYTDMSLQYHTRPTLSCGRTPEEWMVQNAGALVALW